MTAADPFCSLCDVRLTLHDGPGSCERADARARLVEFKVADCPRDGYR